jgi:hypothetical protein
VSLPTALIANVNVIAGGVIIPLLALAFNAVVRKNISLPPSTGSDALLLLFVADLSFAGENTHVQLLLDGAIREASIWLFLVFACGSLVLWGINLKSIEPRIARLHVRGTEHHVLLLNARLFLLSGVLLVPAITIHLMLFLYRSVNV